MTTISAPPAVLKRGQAGRGRAGAGAGAGPGRGQPTETSLLGTQDRAAS
jgi:hypothetical protein